MPGFFAGRFSIFGSLLKGADAMKKTIWLILPVVIIAVVLVAMYAGQRNSLSDQNQELTRQLSEADLAVKTTQELADSRVAAVESDLDAANQQKEEAEAALNEAEAALNAVTAERDDLQAKNTAAVSQLNDGIRQAQQALYALTGEEAGPEKDLREAKTQLEETQVLLSSAQDEIAAYQQAAAEAEDAHRQALEEAQKETKAVNQALQDVQAELSALRDSLPGRIDEAVAAALAETEQTKVTVVQGEARETVLELDSLSALENADLAPGEYVLILRILHGETEAGRLELPYAVAAQEEAPAEGTEEAAAEETPVEAVPEETPAEKADPAPVSEEAAAPAEPDAPVKEEHAA